MPVYTLFAQAAIGLSATSDPPTYTFGCQFTVSQSCTLTGIWFFSGTGATALPVGTAVFRMTGAGAGTIVAGSENDAPSWSGAVASGWVKVSYASGPTLTPGNTYKVTILKDGTTLVYSSTAHYWDSGAGSGGITSGILTAPNNAGGDGGQDTFVTPSAALTYPATSFNATNYWVDVEVTTAASIAAGAGTPDDRSRRLLVKRRILGL